MENNNTEKKFSITCDQYVVQELLECKQELAEIKELLNAAENTNSVLKKALSESEGKLSVLKKWVEKTCKMSKYINSSFIGNFGTVDIYKCPDGEEEEFSTKVGKILEPWINPENIEEH